MKNTFDLILMYTIVDSDDFRAAFCDRIKEISENQLNESTYSIIYDKDISNIKAYINRIILECKKEAEISELPMGTFIDLYYAESLVDKKSKNDKIKRYQFI